MNDDNEKDETTLSGEWVLEDGLYSKYISIHYRHGRVDRITMESGVTEKEYFRRRLDGTA